MVHLGVHEAPLPRGATLVPLTDYLRMHNVMRSVLDSLDARTAHACLFFSVAGAALLREFYNKDARP